jgi:hypothetical protein
MMSLCLQTGQQNMVDSISIWETSTLDLFHLVMRKGNETWHLEFALYDQQQCTHSPYFIILLSPVMVILKNPKRRKLQRFA